MDTLVYETDHIQKLFLRTIETNLQEQELEITLKIKKIWWGTYLEADSAVSTENEQVRKLRSQNRPKSVKI